MSDEQDSDQETGEDAVLERLLDLYYVSPSTAFLADEGDDEDE